MGGFPLLLFLEKFPYRVKFYTKQFENKVKVVKQEEKGYKIFL